MTLTGNIFLLSVIAIPCVCTGLPGIIGAVDGTHVPIIAPSVNENRKNFHSMNVQVKKMVTLINIKYKLLN